MTRAQRLEMFQGGNPLMDQKAPYITRSKRLEMLEDSLRYAPNDDESQEKTEQ